MKRNGVLFGLCLAVLLTIPTLVWAANPGVHYFDCNKCHLSGYTATQMSNNQVCLQCHKSTATDMTLNPGAPSSLDGHTDGRLDIGDASNAMGNNPTYKDYQTSHNWAAPDTQPAAGAQAPSSATYPGFYSRYGASHNKVTCSRCHNPHGEADLGTNPLANPKLLIRDVANANKPMDPEKMCRACHVLYASQDAGNHGRYGHPVPAADYTTVVSTQTSKYKTAAEVDAAAGGSKAELINGKVTCLSCHRVHYADSDSATADGIANRTTLNPGDGKLLKGDGFQFVNDPVRGTSFCNTCHKYDGAMHGPAGPTAIGCMGCHGGHNNTGATSPYYMLNSNFPSLPASAAERAQVWGGIQNGVKDGFCESCHGNIEQNFPDKGSPAYLHSAGMTQCTDCHLTHSDGAFSEPIGCDGCHGSPPKVAAPGNPTAPGYTVNGYAWVSAAYNYQTGSTHYKDETTTPHTSHAGSTSRYGYQCKVCHNTHIDDFAGTHNKDNTSFRDVLEVGHPYDSKAVAAGAASPSYADVAATCNSIYCHSNGGVNTGAGSRTFSFSQPGWNATKNSIVTNANECGSCHGNDATDMLPAGKNNSAAHIKHLQAGFSCNTCHVSTAASATAYQGAGIPATHLNKTVDLAFTTAALKAGGAAAAFPAGSWNGAADPRCDTVYCHSNGNLNNLQYRTISWTAGPTNLSCTACHDINAGADRTAAHQVHVNGSTSDLGRNLDCGVCHADTMTVGNNTTITGATKHVNGTVDVKMNIFTDTGTCSNIACHSDGNFDGTVQYKPVNTFAWTGTPLGNCDDCHGVSGGVTYPSYANGGVGGDSNSHQKHVGGGIVCAECHSQTTATNTAIDGTDKTKHVNKVVEVSGAKITSYTGATETCAAAACHGGGSPQWGGTVACGSCHAANNTLANSHSKHYDSASAGDYALATNSSTVGNYVIQCGICHSPNGAGAISHSGGWVSSVDPRRTAQVNFDGTIASGTYTPGGTEAPDNGFYYTNATCASLYCHGNFGGNGNNATATWGSAASGACGTCHDVDSTATLSGGVHQAHVKTAGITCDYCHGATAVDAAGGIANRALHVNRALNWDFAAAGKPQTAGATYNSAATGAIAAANVGIAGNYAQCANLYCHSTVQASPPSGTTGVVYATPSWGTPASGACSTCHAIGDSLASGSHNKHVQSTTYSVGCAQCHQGAGAGTKHADYAVDVVFNTSWGGTYSGTAAPGNAYGTCTATYCHSNGAGAAGTPPTWGGGAIGCSGCHGGNLSLATNAHDNHLPLVLPSNSEKTGRNMSCGDCHIVTAASGAGPIITWANHVNKLINVRFNNITAPIVLDADAPSYNGTATTGTGATKVPGTAVGDCANVYCHSTGNLADNTGAGAVVGGAAGFKTVSWSAVGLDCADCHGDGNLKAHPVYASGAVGTTTANTHVKHVEGSSINCSVCHQATITDTSLTAASMKLVPGGPHLDRKETVVYNSAIVGALATYDATVGNKTCATTYCHGSGTPQWGGAALNCNACHSASSALLGSHAAHYQPATLVTVNNTTNTTTAAEYAFACGNCHNPATTNHAAGKVSTVQAAQVAFSGGGTYTAAGTAAGTDRGFSYTAGGCASTACHQDGRGGAPNTAATWNVALPVDCTGCHDNNVAAGAGKIMATGAHSAHINDGSVMSNKTCQTCHSLTVTGTDRAIADKREHVDGTRDVHLLGTWDSDGNVTNNWTAGTTTCANVYCHSNGKASPGYVSVDWTTTITGCTACHQGASSGTTLSGGHQAHTFSGATTIGRNLTCNECHSTTVSSNTVISTAANHVNKTRDLMVPNFGAPQAGCATVYCHSNGNAGNLVNNNPAWATSYGCANCHGNGTLAYPTYANGGVGVNANSHSAHMVGGGYACNDCHSEVSTVGTAINGTAPTKHVDKNIDVKGAKISSYAGGTCSNVSCHGGNSPVWGATLGCRDCHANATTDTDNFVYNDGTVALVALDEWTYSGHGRTTAYPVTGNAAADLDTKAGAGKDACLYCHDSTVSHGNANYFRLRSNGFTYSAVADLNGTCRGCHETNTTSFDPDGIGGLPAVDVTATVKVDKFHGGAKHGDPRDAGRFCWDCHDPHGDADAAGQRIQMIQRNPQVNPDPNGKPASLTATAVVFYNSAIGIGVGGFAMDAAPFAQGICNNCHTTTAQYTQLLGANGHPTGQCTICHKHSADTTYDGNAFKGSGCNGCHGNSSAGNYWPDSTVGAAMPTANDAGRHAKHIEVLAARVYSQTPAQLLADAATDAKQRDLCAFCHTTPGADGDHGLVASLPADVDSMQQMWPAYADDNGAWSLAGDGSKGTCATVDCHNNKTTPAGYSWYGATASACIMCHSNAPAEATHASHINAAVTYGRTIACADCHDAAASWATNTKPASSHIDGTFDVSGTVVFSYSGTYPSAKGTCGTNECHNSGRNGAPVNNAYTWGTNDNGGGCNYCHQMVPGQGHQPHFLSGADAGGQIVSSFFSLGGGLGCNKCHTHSGNISAHIDTAITVAAGMTYNSAVLNLDVDQSPDYGTCTTTTCHQNGAGAAVKTPFWNRTPQSSDDCSLCHFNKAPEATYSHDAHIGAPAAIKYNSATLNNTTTTEYRYTCVKCHGNTLANHLNSASWAAPTVNVAAAVAYNAGADTCSNNACHTNGTGGNANLVANWTSGWVGESDSDTCNNCHGNSPTTNAHQVHTVGIHAEDIYSGTTGLLTPATATKSHGDTATSTTINCNLCHSQTVTMARNMYGTIPALVGKSCSTAGCHAGNPADATNVMSVADKTKHADGTKQVVFSMASFKSKAQLRDDITTVPELNNSWTRSGTYKAAAGYDGAKLTPAPVWASGAKTCSTVDCHNGIAATWQAPTNNCMTCHTQLPK